MGHKSVEKGIIGDSEGTFLINNQDETVSLLLGLVCFIASPLWARIWKSADGAKTFEGKLKAYDAETGRVARDVNGLPLMVRQDKLSEADISFLKEWSKSGRS